MGALTVLAYELTLVVRQRAAALRTSHPNVPSELDITVLHWLAGGSGADGHVGVVVGEGPSVEEVGSGPEESEEVVAQDI